ncbi:MAG: Hsp20/alpha crystallin family protein [Chloroflexi bacterium]|nr:Hsp20/alpha crystallin family protein [Chloroflexota bacterium]
MTYEPRFDPMKELQNLGEQITKTVERGIRTMTSSSEELTLDMYEADGNLHITTQAIDGMVKNSIEISLESNVLTISLRTEPETTPTNARYHLQERRFGAVTRNVELSVPVKGHEARAKVDSGSRLLISLPIDDSGFGNITVTPVE